MLVAPSCSRLLALAACVTGTAALCLSNDPSCFPNQSALDTFNASVGGNLYMQRPVGAVCYHQDSSHSDVGCLRNMKNFWSDQWISDHPAAYQESNWAACGAEDSCNLPNLWNMTATCGQGRVPPYAVHAKTAEHVDKYVRFAVKHDLPIVVRNTGHDFKGRSAGKGGFALWTHHLDERSLLENYTPKECLASRSGAYTAVRLGAGVDWLEAYKFANEVGVTLVGGSASKVGAAGGWLLGGGHSFLTPSFGLGVDNLLEMDIVTADGSLQTISECSNPELFWAVRGGGGPTFGIVVSVTYKAHPPMPMAVASSRVKLNRFLTTDDTRLITRTLARVALEMAESGVGGLFNTNFGPHGSYILFTMPGATKEELEKVVAPFFDATQHIFSPGFYDFPTFYSFFSTIVPADQFSGFTAALSSRLIPKSLFAPRKVDELIDAIQTGQEILLGIYYREPAPKPIPEIRTNGTFQILFSPPTKSSIVPSLKGQTSVHPVWYEGWWHVIYAAAWDERDAVHHATGPVRSLTPGGGAYQNEADVFEPDHQMSFWGKNYPRLADIKRSVDPKNVFQVWQGVGFDETSKLFSCYHKEAIGQGNAGAAPLLVQQS